MSTSSHSEPSAPQFRSLLDQYADFLHLAGKKIWRATPELTTALFFRLSPARRSLLVERLERDIQLFRELMEAGEKLTDSPKFLWRYFRQSGSTPCSDIFDKISETDVVEIYNLEQVHVFQNLNFFDWISVTLEEILCVPWYEVSTRDLKIAARLYELAGQMLSGQIRQTIVPDNPWHLVEEVSSVLRLKFDLQVKFISPVFVNHEVRGMIVVNQCRPVSPSSF
jgi:hypothetical protein